MKLFTDIVTIITAIITLVGLIIGAIPPRDVFIILIWCSVMRIESNTEATK